MTKRTSIKISICNELFQGWPIEKVFEYAAQLGYDGVEIAPFTLADSVTEIPPKRRKAIRRAAEENGIEVVGLHWLLAKPEGLYINHPDEIIRIQTQEYIEALIHFCADIGGKDSGSRFSSPKDRSRRMGFSGSHGILPKRPSRYVLRQPGKEMCSTVSNPLPTHGPTSSIPWQKPPSW